jgi:AhpD family alkylhydroperoxidase
MVRAPVGTEAIRRSKRWRKTRVVLISGGGSRFLLTFQVTILFSSGETIMSTFGLIEYGDASPEVRAIYDDIMATRKTDWINNFWKAIAHDPATLKRTWESIKQIMGPGALDPLTKELLYVAVSVTNNCHYCIASHTASAFKKGMTDAMFAELQAVIGMANETNKLVTGYQVEIDERFRPPLTRSR